MMPPVVILAGGLATRLYPETLKIPKSLIEVAGKPFIFHQLALLKRQGVCNVVLCVGKFGEMIQDYVGDGHEWGLKVQYSYDGQTLLGTGGAIKKALPLLPEVFFVLYGDSYLDVDLKPILERFECEGKPALMTVYHNKNKWDKSNILFKNGRVVKYDKKNPMPEMEYLDYGLNILRKSIINEWQDGIPFDLTEVFIKLIEKGEVSAFEVFTRFYEIGSIQGIKETEEYLYTKHQICI
ncbi:MAG: nucleotidyltransferase family protein [Candidatus Methanoperedenaceae archaeon]|nr:nucleotidyltransferase family protein [Candidatus Methanoperedenaceae archaeon]